MSPDVMNSLQWLIFIWSLTKCHGDFLTFSREACSAIMFNESSKTIKASCKDSSAVLSYFRHFNVSIDAKEVESLCTISSHRIKKDTGLDLLTYHNTLESIVDLMIYWKRSNAVFLFDKYSGLRSSQLFIYLEKRHIDSVLMPLDENSDVRSMVLDATTYQNIVIICHPFFLKKIILEASSLGLFSNNFTWIIVNGRIPEEIVGVDIPPNSQVTLLSPLYLITQSDGDESSLFIERNRKSNFCQSIEPSKQTFSHLNLKINYEDKMAAYLKSSPFINIFDVFYTTTNRTEAVRFSHWNVTQKHKLHMFESFHPDDKLRLKERRVRVAVFQHPPYAKLSKINGTLHVTGYLKEMMGTLLTNFNLRHTEREIEAAFGIGVNGTYTGMVGIFYRREADLAMNVLSMTSSRAGGVRYAGPVTKAFLSIIYNRPPAVVRPTTYLMPFDLSVWTGILILLSIMLFATYVTLSASPFSNDEATSTLSQKVHKKSFRALSLTFLDEVMDYPIGGAAKVIQGTLLIGTLVMFVHYTSTFTSFITCQEEHIPFKSIEDVVAKKEYDVLVVRNTRHQDVFQFAPPGPYRQIWKRVQQQGERSFSKTMESSYTDLGRSSRYVLLTDGATYVYLSHNNCSVAFAPVKYLDEYCNTPHRRDFPYSRIFTMGLIKILERGIFRRLMIAYQLDNRPPCIMEKTSESFGVTQVMGIYFLFVMGIALSLLVLLIELILPKNFIYLSLKKRNEWQASAYSNYTNGKQD